MEQAIEFAQQGLATIALALDAKVAKNQRIIGKEKDELLCGPLSLISYAVGVAFGRWNVRAAPIEGPGETDSFSAPPVCAAGFLQGPDGLPICETPLEYPVGIAADGILVDDPEHECDIIRRVRDVLDLVWHDRATKIEKDSCKVAGVKSIRDYFQKPGGGGFWNDHVARYSKSHRKAPIYWLLQSSKRSYSLWFYYPRLDKDLLFKALLKYVEPKIRLESIRLDAARNKKALSHASGNRPSVTEKEIEKQEELLSELRDFDDKLRRVANLYLEPDLDDGVVLNIAPLHELVPWSEAEKYWDELLKGEYEWSSIGKQLRQKGLVK